MTQLLKQKQYHPYAVEEEVPVIYAGVNGFLDKFPAERVPEFEEKFLAYLKAEHSGILSNIRENGALKDADFANLKKATEDFVATF